jgi:glycosyltransferase involved in cell wall biosynthesis
LLLIDNGSTPALSALDLTADVPFNLRLVAEPELGLSLARRRGFAEARGELLVMVDDDNVLDPDYLGRVVAHFAANPSLGAIGGRSLPEFAAPPAPWQHEFFDLLALRDLGPAPLVASGLRPPGSSRNTYPLCAPVGAGMALRRRAVQNWLDAPSAVSDRRGAALTSGGDNDLVFSVLRAGWGVGYFPDLSLTHLIPTGRLDPAYLARLNRGIQKSWMQVLTLHDANDWPPIPAWSVPLRQFKAWFTHRAWSSPASRIRWQGVCGHFEGRVLR